MTTQITDYIYDVLSKNLPRNTLADFSIPVATKKESQRLLPWMMPDHTPFELRFFWKKQVERSATMSMWIDFFNEVMIGGVEVQPWIEHYVGPHRSRHWPMEDTDNREKVAMQILAMVAIAWDAKISGQYPQLSFAGTHLGFISKDLMIGLKNDGVPIKLDNQALLDWRRYLLGYPKIKLSTLPIDMRRLYTISKDLGIETGLHEGYAELVRYWVTIGHDPRIVHYLLHTHLNPDYEWQQQQKKRAIVKVEFQPSRAAKIRLATLAHMQWWKYKNPLPKIVACLRDDFPDITVLQPMIEYFEYYHFPVTHPVPPHIKDYWFHLITKGNQQYGQLKNRKRNRVGRPTKRRRGHYIE